MKFNIITYAYRGLVSIIYFLIGKKNKIKDVFDLDDEDDSGVNMDMSSGSQSGFNDATRDLKNRAEE